MKWPVAFACTPSAAKEYPGFLLAALSQKLLHRSVHVDHIPAAASLAEEPIGVLREDIVVAFVRLSILLQSSRQRLAFQRDRIKNRRGQMHDLRPGAEHFVSQKNYAIGERGKTLLPERIINPVVHSIACQDEIRLELLQNPIQTFVQVRTRKRSSGMARLGETRHCLAWQPNIDQFEIAVRKLSQQNRLDVVNVKP